MTLRVNGFQQVSRVGHIQTLRIRTLGRAEVLVSGQPVQWGASSAETLFWYLHSRVGGASRARILSDLWQQNESPAALNRFRVALCRVRAALGSGESVQEEGGRYRLHPDVLAASDTQQLSALMDAVGSQPGQTQAALLQTALALSGGEYLPDLSNDWLDEARSHWRGLQVRAHIGMARQHCAQQACPLAALELRAALQADPYQPEDLHQRLMICLNNAQGKYVSIAHYRRFLHFLRAELDDSPMPETVELAEQIKHGVGDCLSWPEPLGKRPS